MNLFKTTALALVLGAFGLAHSGGDEAKEQEQPSSRVAKTVSQLHEEIGTIVNNPGASKRKMEAITALLARESEDYTATPISSVSDASTLIGAHSIDELIKRLNITSKNAAPAEEEEEKKSQGSASGEEEEDEGEEEEDEGEEEVDEEEGVQLSATAQAFIASLGLSAENGSPSEVIDAVIAKITATTKTLEAEKEGALKSAAQAREEAAQAQIKLEQANSAYTLLQKTASESAATMAAQLAAVQADLTAQKQTVADLSEEQADLYQQASTLAAVKAALSKGSDAEALAAVRALLNPPAPSEEPAKDQAQGAPRQEQEQGQGSADSTTTANQPAPSDEPAKDQAQGTQDQGSASSTTTGTRTDASADSQQQPEEVKSPAKVKKGTGTPSKSTKKKKAPTDAAAAADDSSAKKEDANA